ncbi:MAG: radical SAM protein [Methanophagales archaeon]|nr:radical SAM protein [Methanophagales archaeon]
MSKSTIKVLLMSPRYDETSIPPFGVAYLVGFLRGQSSVELTAINSDEYSFGELEKMVANGDYDVFATGGLITCLRFCRHMFKLSATMRPEAKRVVGGPMTVIDSHLLFQLLHVDVAVLGEGEETFSELLETLRREECLDYVRGIAYRDENGSITVTEPRPPLDLSNRNIDPDWSFVDLEHYITYPDTRGFFFNRFDSSRPYRVGYTMAGRGCPYRCHFCFSPLGKFRMMSVEKIVSEMKRWRDQYSVDHIRFINENLFTNPREIQHLCQMMIDEKLNLHWSCSLRVNYVNRESLELMKEAGCDYIIYGVESGSDRVLKRMNKHTTVEMNRTAIRLTREAGIYPDVAIMFGYCDETLEDLKKTVDLMIEGNDLPESLAITIAIPGTEMYKELVSKGFIRDQVEYIEKLCDELSKGAIYGETKPILNPTKIPDNIYWQSLLAEKRRLYTEHFFRNRALFSSIEYWGDSVRLQLNCPHCHTPLEVNVCLENPKITRHFCKQCLHYIWTDPFLIPEFKEHFAKVERFIKRVSKEGKPLVIYTAPGAPNAFALFDVDPWNSIWTKVTAVIGDIDSFYYFEVVPPKHARRFVPAAVLITAMDYTNSIRKRLLRQGFSGDDIITLFPTVPIRNLRQLAKRYASLAWHYMPASLQPVILKILQELKKLRY